MPLVMCVGVLRFIFIGNIFCVILSGWFFLFFVFVSVFVNFSILAACRAFKYYLQIDWENFIRVGCIIQVSPLKSSDFYCFVYWFRNSQVSPHFYIDIMASCLNICSQKDFGAKNLTCIHVSWCIDHYQLFTVLLCKISAKTIYFFIRWLKTKFKFDVMKC